MNSQREFGWGFPTYERETRHQVQYLYWMGVYFCIFRLAEMQEDGCQKLGHHILSVSKIQLTNSFSRSGRKLEMSKPKISDPRYHLYSCLMLFSLIPFWEHRRSYLFLAAHFIVCNSCRGLLPFSWIPYLLSRFTRSYVK
jgi:hypothetical protein